MRFWFDTQQKDWNLVGLALVNSTLARSCLLILLFSNSSLSQTLAPTLEGLLARAGQLEKSQDYAGAEKVYQQALMAFPNQPETLKRLGILYQTELNFPQSIESFEKALEKSPQYPEVSFYVGLSYFGLNRYEKALESFDKQLKIDPKYRRAHYYAA